MNASFKESFYGFLERLYRALSLCSERNDGALNSMTSVV